MVSGDKNSAGSASADGTGDFRQRTRTQKIGLFGGLSDSAEGETLRASRHGRLHRLFQIARIASKFDILHGVTPTNLRLMLEALGPTFVKVGQILSMRSEILPEAFRKELSKLRADADPMPYDTVISTLTNEYGRPIDTIFSTIDPTPLGSASLAQVHRARLLTGEDVAVKVQRPGVKETMAQDVEIMRSFAGYATRFTQSAQILDLRGVVEELWDTFQDETDFLMEARNLRDFRRFCAPYAYMDCPSPYINLCTQHVVVMDYVDGISVSHPQELIDAGYSLSDIGEKLVDNYAAQILDEGFFHADPHPGNIIINGGRIVLIDLGMTGRVNKSSRSALKEMIFAVAKRDSPALAKGLLRFTSSADKVKDDYPLLLDDLDSVIDEFGTVNLADLNIGEFFNAIMQLARRHSIAVPSSVTTVARGLVTLEGTVDEFLPDVNMIEIISRHIAASQGTMASIKNETMQLGRESGKALHGVLGALADAKTVSTMLSRGQLRINMELVGSEQPLQQLSDMVNRITMALIVVGLYVGSSIVYFAGIKPVILGIPVIGLMGYVVAFLLSVWIVIDIFRKNRAIRKHASRM
ncbi:MAG: AarF/UbiB family protein [Bifidobacterium aquikefiri]|uniref:ABC transporter n=1 Tax=Bifidobacterium aquikefiri TaxID=1653207 RepID=A0A261G4J0_9BIFI|nr:AarF/UbiB family protein [Bifidobacterium aquikefiri]OZG66103.1 ABC transporter [Bifidobacterium aquikefiri]